MMEKSTVIDLNKKSNVIGLSDLMSNQVNSMALGSDELDDIAETEIIFPDLIASGHLIAFPARAGVGKTQLMMAVSPHLVKSGKKVIYINVDIAAGDLSVHMDHANKHGFDLLTPDIKQGKSVNDVIEFLEQVAGHEELLTDYVFIIDTLKKFADMINKAKLKERLNLFRRLTSRGATVVMLCHCNKGDDAQGNPIFEGCEDLRSDVDELIYLFSDKNSDAGTNLISTECQQKNGAKNRLPQIKNASILLKGFDIVGKPDFVNLKEADKLNDQLNKDNDCIESIRAYLKVNGECIQGDIIEHVMRQEGIGRPTARKVLKRWAGKDQFKHRWYVKDIPKESKIVYWLHPD